MRGRNAKKLKGCTHLIIRKGEIVKVITHLNQFPPQGVVHLKADKTYSFSDFKKSHPFDHHELKSSRKKIIVSTY